MKSSTHVLLLALLLCVALTSRISSVWAKPQGGNSQNRVVGEVVKTDQTTKRLTIKTATGETKSLPAPRLCCYGSHLVKRPPTKPAKSVSAELRSAIVRSREWVRLRKVNLFKLPK